MARFSLAHGGTVCYAPCAKPCFAAALNAVQSDGLNVADYQPGAIMARYRQLQTPSTTASDRLRRRCSGANSGRSARVAFGYKV